MVRVLVDYRNDLHDVKKIGILTLFILQKLLDIRWIIIKSIRRFNIFFSNGNNIFSVTKKIKKGSRSKVSSQTSMGK